ncbi:unnamed protein product (macronuclear) [Paramecium tetraurelia]|uniref:Phospho-2-dehydro-3-deoxyheptonate aldolase n=1 Tax=Paramecium tetraurelia TaxID=5888 RepID=A0BP53_PARTE|nr:uncharacterized protein GSPATT00005069001 [Paramecium tetraurelia]CAK60320.1 unnamed protein product [Paramecium tetraurelia]|eukprot:XP_001427718.1 hypothetical protein (macronuclear) [Paramecium tetraurelia strain d4-2]
MNQEKEWNLDSWKKYPALQQPLYQDLHFYQETLQKLRKLPGILNFEEINKFKNEMIKVSQGDKFVLQLGDCAEVYNECTEEHWKEKFSFYDSMGQILNAIVIGRTCGQFAKPRTQLHEKDGTLNYRGDLINSLSRDERDPDPLRLLLGAHYSKKGIDTLRKYEGKQLWVSHECLHIGYESAFARQHEEDHYYLSNTHFPWIGDRTRLCEHAHSNFAKGIYNPIGIKIGSSINKNEFVNLIKLLNPKNEDGRVFAIIRLGKNKLDKLKDIINWKHEEKLNVSFFLDPMHGNSLEQNGYKIRRIEDIMFEIQQFFNILEQSNEKPAGLHLECTPYDVSECVENDEEIDPKKYTTACDARLNFRQTRKIVIFVNTLLKKLKKKQQ